MFPVDSLNGGFQFFGKQDNRMTIAHQEHWAKNAGIGWHLDEAT